jgi:hypothetical protein
MKFDDQFIAGGAFTVIVILLALQLILFIAALISILASRRYTGGGKFLWILLVLSLQLLGPIGWFLFGRRAQIRTDPIADRR